MANFPTDHEIDQVLDQILITVKLPVTYLPTNIKKVLLIQGLTTLDVLSTITNSDICEIETFFKEKLHQVLCNDTIKREYYVLFYAEPELFELGIGNKRKILKVASLCKKTCNRGI
ncbi:hypothetical protein PPYR_10874 [Photinus pyralis]|uniref:Uncharacterized protein n=1 Tax=Photinus pyralis TaxID=7054 RepID=A0A1Y1NEN2_PHOPY|nr:hypothetical protein PPYR_10874 [Photinus pyralis]